MTTVKICKNSTEAKQQQKRSLKKQTCSKNWLLINTKGQLSNVFFRLSIFKTEQTQTILFTTLKNPVFQVKKSSQITVSRLNKQEPTLKTKLESVPSGLLHVCLIF